MLSVEDWSRKCYNYCVPHNVTMCRQFLMYFMRTLILLKLRPMLLGPTVEYDNGAMAIVLGFQIISVFKKIFFHIKFLV